MLDDGGLALLGNIHWAVIISAMIWATVWKGIALWRAGRNAQLAWFIVLLVVNTMGILEIIYIFAFSRRKPALESMDNR